MAQPPLSRPPGTGHTVVPVKPSFWDTMHADFDDAVFDPVASDVHGAFWRAVDDFAAVLAGASDCEEGESDEEEVRDLEGHRARV